MTGRPWSGRSARDAATIFLDTNVFLYAVGAADPQQEPCRRIIRAVAAGRLDAATSSEVVQEILHVLARRGRADAVEVVRNALALFPDLLPVGAREMAEACDLLDAQPGLSVRDAVHAATMRSYEIDTIVSVDAHFDAIRGIRRLEPKAAARR